jgi:hypothetical protein
MVPATLWGSWVDAGPVEWSMDPGLTASAEGSHRPADGVRSSHEGREAYQHRVVWTLHGYQYQWRTELSDSVRERVAHVLESPRHEIRARGEKSVKEERLSPRLSSRNIRSLRKDLLGVWKDCRGEGVGMEEKVVFGNYGSWRAEDWYPFVRSKCECQPAFKMRGRST